MPATTDPLLSIPDVAAMFDRAVGSVEHWRVERLLPEPDEVLGRTPGWRKSTLLRWGRQTGRLHPDGRPVRARNRTGTPR